MKMLTDLRKKIVENTQIIDFAISKYFANRLGVKDIKTINALGIDGNLTFNQKVNLFCEIMPLTKIDSAKLKVYTKINNEIVINGDILTFDEYFSNSLTLFPIPLSSSKTLTISSDNLDYKEIHISIINISGQEVFSEIINLKKQKNIDLNSLNKGLYIMQIEDTRTSKIASRKLIIE